jgi:hypothetical protein
LNREVDILDSCSDVSLLCEGFNGSLSESTSIDSNLLESILFIEETDFVGCTKHTEFPEGSNIEYIASTVCKHKDSIIRTGCSNISAEIDVVCLLLWCTEYVPN